MKTSDVYLVIDDDEDCYEIIAAFSTEEKAKRFSGNYVIRHLIIDEFSDEELRCNTYRVLFDEDGKIERCEDWELIKLRPKEEGSLQPGYESVIITLFAKSEEDAIKIATEKRTILIEKIKENMANGGRCFI
jgi:D-lyxose ketol-isomerase